MPVKARTRAALVDAIRDPDLPLRPRSLAAEELIHSFPAVTRTLTELLGLFPRPISPDTFDACCDAVHRRRDRREFRVIHNQETE